MASWAKILSFSRVYPIMAKTFIVQFVALLAVALGLRMVVNLSKRACATMQEGENAVNQQVEPQIE